ncbi:MAG: hypothetical protein ACI8PZ_001226 [Myxococcota bacterium]|jgi:hypothetical protein
MQTIDWAEARYRLVHDERYLDAFLARDFGALRLSPEDAERLNRLESADVLWAARGRRTEIRRRLLPVFDAVFERWSTYMSDDPRGEGLVTLFLQSPDFRRVHDGAEPLHVGFRRFARRTGVFPDSLLWRDEALAAK